MSNPTHNLKTILNKQDPLTEKETQFLKQITEELATALQRTPKHQLITDSLIVSEIFDSHTTKIQLTMINRQTNTSSTIILDKKDATLLQKTISLYDSLETVRNTIQKIDAKLGVVEA